MALGQAGKTMPLRGKIVGIHFRRASTRTRTAFTVGAIKLGAYTVAYGPKDLQDPTGETVQDTFRVLSEFLDALVIRTNESIDEMKILAAQENMAVINAMSGNEHPT
jgi:ornithine carbamoyltransferase